jgi:chromosome segregation ATPase
MMRNRVNDVLNAQKAENTEAFMFKEAIKTLLDYMGHLTSTIEKIDNEITSLKSRVSHLEQIPKFPQVKHLSTSHQPISVKTQFSRSSPPEELQSELTSVLEESVKLKSGEQAKEEELYKLLVSLQEEFKNISKNQQMKENLTSDLENSLAKIRKKFIE